MGDAVRKRDAAALVAMLSSKVTVNFGGEWGKVAFVNQWHPEDRQSGIWPLLSRLLPLGCAGSESARIIPWLGNKFFNDSSEEVRDPDSFAGQAVVIEREAKLRKTADPTAGTIRTRQWDVVWLVDNTGDGQTKVRLADGREGWLFDDQIYSPLDYRILLEREAGEWMITALVAGD